LAGAFWLVVWQCVAWSIDREFILASPMAAMARLIELAPTADFWATIGFSLARIGLGFLAAAVVGTVLAVASHVSGIIDALAAPLIATIRSAPVVSFIILLLLWVDTTVLAAATSFLMVLPVMYANVREGIHRRDRSLLEAARVFDVPLRRRIWAVDVPAIAPFMAAATRAGVGLAWKSGVAAEVIGVASGSIGERLYEAKIFLESADLFAWTAVIVALSVASERVVLWALRRVPGADGVQAPASAAKGRSW
jgi:NitT/TauT family transport system permease protein